MSANRSKYISIAELKKHNTDKSTWLLIGSTIYDVTKFLNDHPGGAEAILEVAGTDATQAFDDVGHSDDAVALLAKYKIGTLDPNAAGASRNHSSVQEPPPPRSSPPPPPVPQSLGYWFWGISALGAVIVAGFVVRKYYM